MTESGILTKLRILRKDTEAYEEVASGADRHEWREVQAVLEVAIEALKQPGSIR